MREKLPLRWLWHFSTFSSLHPFIISRDIVKNYYLCPAFDK